MLAVAIFPDVAYNRPLWVLVVWEVVCPDGQLKQDGLRSMGKP